MDKVNEFLKKGRKVFVLDTNILLYSPHAIETFEDNVVVISDVVLDELDKLKSAPGELGFNSRTVARKLDEYRQDSDNGDLFSGYYLPTGGLLKVELNHEDIKVPTSWGNAPDTRLLKVALGLNKDLEFKDGQSVIVVSNDLFVRIKASVLGIKTEEFLNEATNTELYLGRRTLYSSSNVISAIHMEKEVENPFKEHLFYEEDSVEPMEGEPEVNEYILLKSVDTTASVLCVWDGKNLKKIDKRYIKGIKPITSGQTMVLDALTDDSRTTPLTIIKGPAGTGKTLLALAVGIEQVEKGNYKRILYLRSNTMLEEEIGFLPGTEEEKLEWILRPVKDNLEIIFGSGIDGAKRAQEFLDLNLIKVESVGFMRGRSLNNLFVIIDEAQNLTPKQIKTLLSRAGKNSKIILMGDIEQIDKPYLDKNNNGLSYASDRLRSSKIVKQITLLESESERSPLSYEIVKNMK